MPSVGRKFLLAGRGGLNITHSEPADAFLARYGPAAPSLRAAIAGWTPADLAAWCAALDQPTFVGTSGRVFPASFKTSPLLRAWLRRLDRQGVTLRPRHRWLGWDQDGRLRFETLKGDMPSEVRVETAATVLALGGASWPNLGADGRWTAALAADGVAIAPLRPANGGFAVDWSAHFREKFAGHPLKGVALAFDGRTSRGEVMVTRVGLEGSPLYALGPWLRGALEQGPAASLGLALRPDLSLEAIESRLRQRQPKQSFATAMRKVLSLSPVAIGLLREVEHRLSAPLAGLEPPALARLINAVPIPLASPMPIGRAISTAGGVTFASVDESLMLRHRPGTFVAGEMLDWEAPTGGYLLQACFLDRRRRRSRPSRLARRRAP